MHFDTSPRTLETGVMLADLPMVFMMWNLKECEPSSKVLESFPGGKHGVICDGK